LRRRGYTPSAILEFVKRAGVAKAYSIVDIGLLEHCIREELNTTAPRRIAVLDPLKITVSNFPENKVEYFELPDNPSLPDSSTRKVPFTKTLFIEKSDFCENPPGKYFRLKPGGEVRLMGSYIVKCEEIIKDANGEVVEVIVSADLETGNKMPADGRKIKGTIHWVSAQHAISADAMLYDHLFTIPNVFDIPEDKTYSDYLNPDSLTKLTNCKLEPSLADAKPGERFQFVRNGYFCKDSRNANTFNRIETLKDTWGKVSKE